jgi:DNA repair protein RadC
MTHTTTRPENHHRVQRTSRLPRQLREAAAAVDIPPLDHVIIGRRGADPLGRGYYSFREAGLL